MIMIPFCFLFCSLSCIKNAVNIILGKIISSFTKVQKCLSLTPIWLFLLCIVVTHVVLLSPARKSKCLDTRHVPCLIHYSTRFNTISSYCNKANYMDFLIYQLHIKVMFIP